MRHGAGNDAGPDGRGHGTGRAIGAVRIGAVGRRGGAGLGTGAIASLACVAGPPEHAAAVTGSARWTAAARARESDRADALFRDPWADALAGEDGWARLAASEGISGPNVYLPIRTRFFDDLVAQATWAQQLVVLGVGMDTRAYRLGLPATTRVFEVDHGEIFEARRPILGQVAPTCARVEVVADLRGAWGAALVAAGLDPRRPTLWIAEGLFFHLPAPAVDTVLSSAAALSWGRALIAADVFGTGLLRLPGLRPLIEQRRRLGQPLPFCTDDPAAVLAGGGWRLERVDGPGELSVRYGRPLSVSPAGGVLDPTMRTYLLQAARVADG